MIYGKYRLQKNYNVVFRQDYAVYPLYSNVYVVCIHDFIHVMCIYLPYCSKCRSSVLSKYQNPGTVCAQILWFHFGM